MKGMAEKPSLSCLCSHSGSLVISHFAPILPPTSFTFSSVTLICRVIKICSDLFVKVEYRVKKLTIWARHSRFFVAGMVLMFRCCDKNCHFSVPKKVLFVGGA